MMVKLVSTIQIFPDVSEKIENHANQKKIKNSAQQILDNHTAQFICLSPIKSTATVSQMCTVILVDQSSS